MWTLHDELIEDAERHRRNPFEVKPYNPSHAPWNYSGLHLPVFPPTSPTHDEVNFSHEEAVKMLEKMIENDPFVDKNACKTRKLIK